MNIPLRHRIRFAWHSLILRVFRSHIQDVVTEAIHPEFGFIWQEGEMGFEMLEAAYQRGHEDGHACSHSELPDVAKLPEYTDTQKSKPS